MGKQAGMHLKKSLQYIGNGSLPCCRENKGIGLHCAMTSLLNIKTFTKTFIPFYWKSKSDLRREGRRERYSIHWFTPQVAHTELS